MLFSGIAVSDVENLQHAAQSALQIFAGVPLTEMMVARWYDIVGWDATQAGTFRRRAYGFTLAQISAISIGSNALTVTGGAAEGTDYILDITNGRVFIKNTPAAVSAIGVGSTSVALTVTWAAPAAGQKAVIDEVKAQTKSSIPVALKFIQVNPANGDIETEWQFHQVTLKGDGDFALISEEWESMDLTGAAEQNVLADPDSPTMTMRQISARKT